MNKTRGEKWELILVVLDDDTSSVLARQTIESICREELKGCSVTILEASRHSDVLREQGIFAIPTLIRIKPGPPRKIIGSLANRNIVLHELGLEIKGPPTSA